jgi:hypothetical protein
MTPNNQVSPMIRISRGERDASARATHLEAAFEKYSKTTIERKQMSTTTNFKRIALVAVASLGLGVLSSVPSNAAINADTVTLSSATASQTTAETYTATSAVVTVSFFGAQNDSMSITAALTAAPDGNTALPLLQLVETSSAIVDTDSIAGAIADSTRKDDTVAANTAASVRAAAGTVTTTAKFAVYLQGASNAGPTKAGTYTVKITPLTIGNSGALQGSTAQTLTITVSTAAIASTTPSTATSKVYLQARSGNGTAYATPIADSVVSGTRTVATNPIGFVYYNSLNAAGGAVVESITAEISGPGILGSGAGGSPAAAGRSISIKNGDTVSVWADGTSGVGTISIKGSTSGVVLGTKTVTFYGAVATLAGTAETPILAVGANAEAVSVAAKDSASAKVGALAALENLYAFSSDTTIATVPATNLRATYAQDSALVTVTGVKAGTATITFGNASTLAASTITSAPVTVRVGSTAIASVTVAFDKATYVPGEKATITITLKDATGQLVVPDTYELWGSVSTAVTTGSGLTSAKTWSQGTGPAATETAVTTSALTGLKTYTVYMPVTAGEVSVTGTLAKALDTTYPAIGTLKTAAAIQGTVVTAKATVTDSGAAALAAVNALATTVASLRTLIVTLTNLVLKIQKKVKA